MRGKSPNPIRGNRRNALVALVTVVAAAAFESIAAGRRPESMLTVIGPIGSSTARNACPSRTGRAPPCASTCARSRVRRKA
jgi:hypothetical protein